MSTFALAATAEHKTLSLISTEPFLRAGAQQRGSWGSTGAGYIHYCIPKHAPRHPQCQQAEFTPSCSALQQSIMCLKQPPRGCHSDPTLIPLGSQQSSTALVHTYLTVLAFVPSWAPAYVGIDFILANSSIFAWIGVALVPILERRQGS